MLQQMALFDVLTSPGLGNRSTRKESRTHTTDPSARELPDQMELRLKWARKIAFKRRYREPANATNDHKWTLSAIHRLHQEMFRDWEERFPALTLRSQQLEYWAWMLADTNDPFSFRDVLIVAGYRNPDSFIDALPNLAPDWVHEALARK